MLGSEGQKAKHAFIVVEGTVVAYRQKSAQLFVRERESEYESLAQGQCVKYKQHGVHSNMNEREVAHWLGQPVG